MAGRKPKPPGPPGPPSATSNRGGRFVSKPPKASKETGTPLRRATMARRGK